VNYEPDNLSRYKYRLIFHLGNGGMERHPFVAKAMQGKEGTEAEGRRDKGRKKLNTCLVVAFAKPDLTLVSV